ncbi:DUF3152 domain-containing protein [Streptomyces sp. NPDC056987]|uniref:DUF3152 domain-containing protein n=1 Tax=Streptomyces sp. NPDC056987 TaxID=3345988 RepID=UPI00363C5323
MIQRTSHARPRGGRRRRPKRSARAGRAHKAPLVAGVTAVTALAVIGLAVTGQGRGGDGGAAAPRNDAPAAAPPSPSPSPSRSADTAPGSGTGSGASSEAKAPKPTESPGPSRSAGSPAAERSGAGIPKSGPGTFTTAGAGSGTAGGGRIVTYSVSVEDGLKESAAATAAEVDRILADPRGWTADGATGFRRVAGGTADFVVQLATPDTVDRVCGEYQLDTGGEVNCNVGRHVMVNLKRWRLATPAYAHDVSSYRALIINHEVGHFLGHGHETCAGAGKPAPAMMQQIKGLRGCVINAWPYAADGTPITGPPVP